MQMCKLFIAFLYIVSNHRWTGAGAFENRREIRHIFLGRALPRKRQAFQFPHLAVNRSNFNLTPYKIFSEIRPYLIHPQIETTWKPYKCKFKAARSLDFVIGVFLEIEIFWLVSSLRQICLFSIRNSLKFLAESVFNSYDIVPTSFFVSFLIVTFLNWKIETIETAKLYDEKVYELSWLH